jgi:serine/threonine-protein kinase HipA
LLVTRYDRVRSDSASSIRRLHQEDLCQALGIPPNRKYEAEGGPTFVRVANVVRDHVYQPLVDVRRLIQWQAYNLVIGNSDGHAKNLAITYSATGATELAPFYDLVSTREYKGLDRKLAMGIGGRQNPDEIGRAQWIASSADLRIGERVILDLVSDVAQRSLDVLPDFVREFRELHGKHPILQTLPAATAKRARRVLRVVAA